MIRTVKTYVTKIPVGIDCVIIREIALFRRFLMKKIMSLFVLAILTLSLQPAFAGRVSSSCSFKGVPLYGKVKVVNSFEDFKVKKVTSFEDLKVKKVSSFPDRCGRWQFVDSFEDFKIKYVDSFEDFSIKFVDSFEGI